MVAYNFRTVSGNEPAKNARSIKLVGDSAMPDVKITVQIQEYFQEGTPCKGIVTETNIPLFPVGKEVSMVRAMSDVTIEED